MSVESNIDLDSDPRSLIGTACSMRRATWCLPAVSDPKHLAQWWGPDGFTITTSSFDFRAGGVWRFVMHGPDGRDYQNRVTYR